MSRAWSSAPSSWSSTASRAAIKARESTEYKAALDALSDGVDRDFRIVEGVG